MFNDLYIYIFSLIFHWDYSFFFWLNSLQKAWKTVTTTKNNNEQKYQINIQRLKQEHATNFVMLQRESERKISEAEERLIETKQRCQKEISILEQSTKESYQRGRGELLFFYFTIHFLLLKYCFNM